MKIIVEKGNLFDVPARYAFAHCVSFDFKLGAGIALEFEKKFKIKNDLIKLKMFYDEHPDKYWDNSCVYVKNVFNLVTKNKYYEKPTYYSLEKSLASLRRQVEGMNIHFLAMPKIGCGLDKLEWEKVLPLIEQYFRNWEGEILVRYL